MAGRRYIHYGSPEFCAPAFVPVTNTMGVLNKPLGGLWASPVDSEHSWYNWCKDNEFVFARLSESFEFELSPEARVLELNPDNVWRLPEDEKSFFKRRPAEERNCLAMVEAIDFETLKKEYDVLECSLTKHPELYWALYGWDCDCILVMNPDVIVEVKK